MTASPERPKECPCCGDFAFCSKDPDGLYFYKCSDCGLEGPHDEFRETALRKWNRRYYQWARKMYETVKGTKGPGRRLHWCSACHSTHVLAQDRFCAECGRKFIGNAIEAPRPE